MKATVQIVRNNSQTSSKGEGDRRVLKIRVTHNRLPRTYSANGKIKITAEEFKNKRLKNYKMAYEEVLPAYNIACELVEKLGNDFSFDTFGRLYYYHLNGKYRCGDFRISVVLEEYLKKTEKSFKTRKIYNAAVNWVLRYDKNTSMEHIDKKFVDRFAAFIRKESEGIHENTVRLYFRHLKALYNYAVSQKYIEDKHPFKGMKLSSTRKMNSGLSLDSIKKIFAYHSDDKLAQFARDFFVLSFELNGHYYSDILRLRNRNFRRGADGLEVKFIRHKTMKAGIEVTIALTDYAVELFNKYGRINLSKPNDYILPYLNNVETEAQEVDRITTMNAKINDGLRIVADDLGMEHFTISQARHTYATIRIEKGANLTDVQAEMGHSSYETTRGYVNMLNREAMRESKELKEILHT